MKISQNSVAFSGYMNFKVSMAWQALFDFEEKKRKSYFENGLLAFKVTKPSKWRKYSGEKSLSELNPSFQLERIIIEYMG